jgi:hypothetical protein
MKGIYTVERTSGTAVYLAYTPRGEQRVRELYRLVPAGLAFSKRLAAVRP